MVAPKDFLARSQGQVVVVVLKDSRTLKGKLEGWDEFINLSLEEAEETTESRTRKLGKVVVRGSQVIAVQAEKLGPAPAVTTESRPGARWR
ncbi:MAG: RNA-binding protein [Euryarchaeota archaeon]|nr:RNA-binding protein [Euryarchaeota archaeon]MDE1835006.1 RNA-binding protein [Euryarchaeota archaeon]MDE1882180.1 RNA-binding protein [Euryarchaeota archaeon]MDE2044845.1 RNA-binding protein [Thermoplasmata archaeon]